MKFGRASNFKPVFTDQEIITVYLFAQLNEKFNHRQIHRFIRDYWLEWFPDLPSYQAFNRRLNLLTDNFQTLFAYLLETLHRAEDFSSEDFLIDSMPVLLAVGTRARRAKVAPEVTKTGFCATKQIHFHGVRLHLIAGRQSGKLPTPARIWLREGNIHDLTAVRDIADELPSQINLFGDKAYADSGSKTELETNQINLKWLIDKTDMQRAKQVRSIEGLIIHCLGKLTFALLLLNFSY